MTNSQRNLGIAEHRLGAVTGNMSAGSPRTTPAYLGRYIRAAGVPSRSSSCSSSSFIVKAQYLDFSLQPKEEAKLLPRDCRFVSLRLMSTRKPIRLPPRRKRFSMQSLALRSCLPAICGVETGYSFGWRVVFTLAVRTLHLPIRPGLLRSVAFRNSPGCELHHVRCHWRCDTEIIVSHTLFVFLRRKSMSVGGLTRRLLRRRLPLREASSL